MKAWISGFYKGFIVGIIFEIISFTLAHTCQLVLGSDPITNCRTFVLEFHWLALVTSIPNVRVGYITSMAIILLVFGIIGSIMEVYKKKRKR